MSQNLSAQASTPQPAARTRLAAPAAIAVAAVAAGVLYLAVSASAGVWGFALDDAWIHQTYARNLAQIGQFAFVPGVTSSGSTSPLWTLLIALGYKLGLDFKLWTYGLGIAFLAATALGAFHLATRLLPGRQWAALIAGLGCALEWHMVWAAVSGMETILFTALSVWLLVACCDYVAAPGLKQATLSGLAAGLLVLTRPEGSLLAGLAALAVAASLDWRKPGVWGQAAAAAAALAIFILPWMAFNYAASGTLMPNTFYAKQREYAVMLAALSLPQRAARVALAPLVGAQVMLVPGLVSLLAQIRGSRAWPIACAGLAWIAAHLATYALFLPVTYQHGRYEMTIIPMLIVLGVCGTARWLEPALRSANLGPRVIGRAAALAAAVTLAAFVLIGARAYATDVSIIEGEMVGAARWLAGEAGPGDVIAAHDIGAIGYFTRRPLIDMAGLVSPEVIPIIRNEDALAGLLQERGAAYLVTFPSWYPALTGRLRTEIVYTGMADGAPEHMTIYRLPRP